MSFLKKTTLGATAAPATKPLLGAKKLGGGLKTQPKEIDIEAGETSTPKTIPAADRLVADCPIAAVCRHPAGMRQPYNGPRYASTHVLATQPLRQARTPLPQTLGEADTDLQQTSVCRQHGPPVRRHRLGLWQT